MIADSVTAIISSVTYFFRRKFTTCGLVVRYLDLIVVFHDGFLVVGSALSRALSTADSDLFMKN